jgi:hypothetical protein
MNFAYRPSGVVAGIAHTRLINSPTLWWCGSSFQDRRVLRLADTIERDAGFRFAPMAGLEPAAAAVGDIAPIVGDGCAGPPWPSMRID